MATLILPATTLGAQSKPFVVRTRAQATGIAVGLAGAETANLQISVDQGATWQDVLPVATFQLSATVPSRGVGSPGLYRYNKGVTVAAVPIYAATEADA